MTGLGLSGLSWTHNLSAHTVNNLTWTFSRNRNQTTPFFAFTSDVDANRHRGLPPIRSITDRPFVLLRSPTRARCIAQSDFVARQGHCAHRRQAQHFVGGDFARIRLNSLTDSNARGTVQLQPAASSRHGTFSANGQPIANTGYPISQTSCWAFRNPARFASAAPTRTSVARFATVGRWMTGDLRSNKAN